MVERATRFADGHGPAVCVVVPNGTHRPDALAAAVSRAHPSLRIGAIWCGDPHRRPPSRGVPWWDDDAPIDEGVLAACAPHVAEWRHALAAVAALGAGGPRRVLLLWAGAVAVLGPIEELLGAAVAGAPLALVPRCLAAVPPDDGLVPDVAELVATGPYHTHVAAFGLDAAAVSGWLGDQLDPARACGSGRDEDGRDLEVGLVLARAASIFGASTCGDPAIGAGAWRWPDADPSLLVVPEHDTTRPWTLGSTTRRPMRVEVVDHPQRARVLAGAASQLDGRRRRLALPGGVPVDESVRAVARDHPDARPWTRPGEFRRILAREHWARLRAGRLDLSRAFPAPEGASADAFVRWQRRAFIDDGASLLIGPCPSAPDPSTEPSGTRGSMAGTGSTGSTGPTVSEPPERDGVNVIGYLTRDLGLGDVARRIVAACAAGGVPTSTVDHRRTQSPRSVDAPAALDVVRHDASIAVVNADQFSALLRDIPAIGQPGRRLVAYWFWEVAGIPELMRRVAAVPDEIWVATRFVADSFAGATDTPVRLVPIPIPKPVASPRQRDAFAPLRDHADAFVFLVTLDHLSVTARKNPLAAIDAYRRAFGPTDGTVLLVKTMNGRHRPIAHARLVAAAAGRDDVLVWDRVLARSDQMALVAGADCVVSLHRSEGLGLHLAEAMWLGTPTIATRYSGNLDLADDASAALVGATLVPVRGGEGVYPSTCSWAEPDLDEATAAMQRMVADQPWRAGLATAALARMRSQPSPADTGRVIAAALQDVRCR